MKRSASDANLSDMFDSLSVTKKLKLDNVSHTYNDSFNVGVPQLDKTYYSREDVIEILNKHDKKLHVRFRKYMKLIRASEMRLSCPRWVA